MNDYRQKDPASSQNLFCFTADELIQYRSGNIDLKKKSDIDYHLYSEKCKRCLELYLSSKISGVEDAYDLSRPSKEKDTVKNFPRKKIGQPSLLEKGQIWTTSCDVRQMNGTISGTVEMAVPVCIYNPGNGEKSINNQIRVFPVSVDTEYHCEGYDVIINAPDPLNIPVLIAVFDEKSMLAGNLSECLCTLHEEDMARIQTVRNQFIDGNVKQPDPDIIKWQQKENELSLYLSGAVNESLWEESEVHLEPYRKAADDSGIMLSEIKQHILAETDEYAIAILQKRDKVYLRFVSEKVKPLDILINSQAVPIISENPGQYETLLGYVEQLSGITEITIRTSGGELNFVKNFLKMEER